MGYKKLNAVLLEKKVVETKIVEKPVVAFVRSFSKEGTLPFGLQFDKKSGILKYKNLHVTLSGQGLKLFTHLINSQQSVIAPQIIYSQILGNALKKEKIGKAERDSGFLLLLCACGKAWPPCHLSKSNLVGEPAISL